MPDPITATVLALKANTDVLALSQGRVFGAELPSTESIDMPRSAVVIRASGGPGNANYSPVYEQRVDVMCYGETAALAMQLSLKCQICLQNLTRQTQGTTILYRAISSGGHNYHRDPQVPTWPIVFTTWLIATNQNEV
jgi:hypothetical protein